MQNILLGFGEVMVLHYVLGYRLGKIVSVLVCSGCYQQMIQSLHHTVMGNK